MREAHTVSHRMLVALALFSVVLLAAPLAAAAPSPTVRPPAVVIVSDKTVITTDECVTFTVTVTNPSENQPESSVLVDGMTWTGVKTTIPIDPALSISSATSTLGTATINGQNVIVNGGITLPPQAFFVTSITCCSVGIAPKMVTTNAYVEYKDDQGVPQEPVDTTLEPADVQIVAAPPPPPLVPEASTLILAGSAATGLAGYIGMQIRARRRKRD